MHFVNWQRKISIENYEGHVAVVKINKTTKGFHEALLVATYLLISFLMGHPTSINTQFRVTKTEGNEIRSRLANVGIPTPQLYSISEDRFVEEFFESGDLYSALSSGRASAESAVEAGSITGIMHRCGLVFIDNKAQNYLIGSEKLVRTDLAFIQRSSTVYARSMDIATFLASLMDLDCYSEVEDFFFQGYHKQTGKGFPYLSLILRNVLAVGLSFGPTKIVQNMMKNSHKRLSY
jgi:tRNA A-37 threonylcarbamoyl transferase component Bud32